MKNLCSRTQCGGFQFLPILDLWGISFHAVVVVGLGKDLLFEPVLGHCGRNVSWKCWCKVTPSKNFWTHCDWNSKRMFALTLSGYWLGAVCLNAFGTFSLTNSFGLKKNALFLLYIYNTIFNHFYQLNIANQTSWLKLFKLVLKRQEYSPMQCSFTNKDI